MTRSRRAFTLVELLVVVAIIAILAAILFPVFASAKMAGKKTADLNNLKQIGLGMKLYADDYDGFVPRTSHTIEEQTDCWVATLRPYLGNTDRIRICPADPIGEERLKEGGTSYVLNSYVAVPGVGAILSLDLLPRPADTMTTFVISDRNGASWTQDHCHAYNWFRTPVGAYGRILNDIQPDRFRVGGSTAPHIEGAANYLYADTHVKSLPALKIKGWADTGFNFAVPPDGLTTPAAPSPIHPKTMRLRLPLILLASLVAPLALAQTYANTFDQGHTDGPAVTYENGLFNVVINHDDDVSGEELEYDPADTLLVATEATRINRPTGSQWDFLGVGANQPFYWLPQTQYGDPVLDLGTAAEDLNPSQFGTYDPDGPGGRGVAKWVKFSVLGVSGPGVFSGWSGTNDGTDTPSLSQVLTSNAPGAGSPNAIIIAVGGHVHYNWGFSAPGDYAVTWQASSVLANGQTIVSDPTVVNYRAGSAPVPEPASLAALGLGVAAVLRRRRKA